MLLPTYAWAVVGLDLILPPTEAWVEVIVRIGRSAISFRCGIAAIQVMLRCVVVQMGLGSGRWRIRCPHGYSPNEAKVRDYA